MDGDGEQVSGQITSSTEADAFERLRSRGLSPISLKAQSNTNRFFTKKELSKKDNLVFIRQLSILLAAGVPLIESIDNLSKSTMTPLITERAQKIGQGLRAGETLSKGLETHFDGLPVYVVRLAELGEATGSLGGALTEAAEQMDYDMMIAGEVRSALTYPAFLAVAGTVIVTIMFLFVVPRFAELLGDSRENVPALSRAIIDFSVWLQANWIWAAVSLVGLVCLVVGAARISGGSLPAIFERVPIIRTFQARRDVAGWCRTMGGAINQGAGILQALELAERGVLSPSIKQGLAKARMAVRRGQHLDESLIENMPSFDSIAVDMIRTGRSSGQLGKMLMFAADIYRRDVQERTKRLTALAEPLAVTTISLVVGTIVISIVMAMTSIYEFTP